MQMYTFSMKVAPSRVDFYIFFAKVGRYGKKCKKKFVLFLSILCPFLSTRVHAWLKIVELADCLRVTLFELYALEIVV